MQEQTKVFSISGRIQNEHDEGIFGLRVVAYDNDLLFDDRLGASVTAEDGSFRLHYAEADFRDLFEAKPDVYIEVFDCNGKKVYSSAKATEWQAGAEVQIDAIIPDVKLEEHIEKSRPLARLHGGLVASEKLDAIDAAAELLQSRIDQGVMPPLGGMGRPPKFRNMIPLSAAYCPAPDILGFDDILDTVWGVHFNDPRVGPVFEDILDTVFYRFRVRAPEVAAAAAKDWAEDRPLEFEAFTELFKTKREYLSPGPTDTLIERDRLIPVMAAAVIAARGDRVVENRYLGILLGQFGALYQLDKVYRAARGALASNPHGIPGFAHLLGHVGGTCGAEDRPMPFPPRLDDVRDINEILRLEMIHCAAEMVQASRSGALAGGTYEIVTANWSDGCPGSPIVLTGTNFGGLFPDHNRVLFTHRNGIETIPVAPASPSDWTDTRIEVALPPDAGPGPVSLSIVGNYASVCGRAILPPRRGNSMAFSGGAAYIRYFTANYREGEFRVDPGDTITLRWFVVPSDATVRLHIEQDETVIANNQRVDAESDFTVNIPAGRASLTVCTLTAENVCGDVDPPTITIHSGLVPDLEIAGMEVTQSIQFYRAADHLTDDPLDPDDPHDQENNSVQLVVGKPALLRVYVRSGLPLSYEGGRIAAVTGTLDVERIVGGTATSLTTLYALPITAEADYSVYEDERGDLNTTLNFLIPANYMSGRLRLTATIQTPVGLLHAEATDQITVDVTLEQTLQVAGIMVSYNGPPFMGAPVGTPNLVLPAPTLADLTTTAARTLTAYPVRSDSAATFRVAGTIPWSDPLQDPMLPAGQGCSVNWNALMVDLRAAAALDAATAVGNWVYYGLLATGMPIGAPPVPVPGVDYVDGCGGNGVGAGQVGAGWTMAHEVGHAFGLQHVFCRGDEGNPDPNYPAYSPYNPGSIGEYGFEFNGSMNIHPPLTTTTPAANAANDFMSYCSDEWISPYHYDRLLNTGLLTPTTIPAGIGAGADVEKWRNMKPQPLISIIGFADVDDVQVYSVSRLVTKPNFIGGTLTDLTMELLNKKGEVISSAPAYSFRLEGPGQFEACDKSTTCRPMIQAFVPNVARGSMLRIRRGKNVLWKREAPPIPVTVKEVSGSIAENNSLKIEWDVEIAEGLKSRASLRWSNDEGKTWNGLAVGIKEHSAELNLVHVPGGEVVFEVMVDDGFDTANGVSAPVQVPHKPPTVAILSPTEGITVRAGNPLRLWGVCTDEGGKRLPENSCTWLLDGKAIASGTDVTIEAPTPGEHKIAFRATDPHGTTDVIHTITVQAAT